MSEYVGPNRARFDAMENAISGPIQADKIDRLVQVIVGLFVAGLSFAVSNEEVLGLALAPIGFFVGFGLTGTMRTIKAVAIANELHLRYLHKMQSEALDLSVKRDSKSIH